MTSRQSALNWCWWSVPAALSLTIIWQQSFKCDLISEYLLYRIYTRIYFFSFYRCVGLFFYSVVYSSLLCNIRAFYTFNKLIVFNLLVYVAMWWHCMSVTTAAAYSVLHSVARAVGLITLVCAPWRCCSLYQQFSKHRRSQGVQWMQVHSQSEKKLGWGLNLRE